MRRRSLDALAMVVVILAIAFGAVLALPLLLVLAGGALIAWALAHLAWIWIQRDSKPSS